MPSPITSEIPAPKSALDERRPFLLAMSEEDVERQPKVDASVAAETVIGVVPRILHLRDGIVAQFGAPAGTLVDDLLVVARATKQADVECDLSAVSGDLSPLEAEVRKEHTLLFTDGQSLANRGVIDPQRLELARGTQGYRTLIHNTMLIVGLLREYWPTIAGQTPLTAADLDRAEAKATRMLSVLGERDMGSNRIPSAELRLRALTALVNHYDDVRRMVGFLRWKEADADEIAPSLYARRPGRRGSDEPTTDQPASPQPVTPPAVVQPAGPAPVSPTGIPLSPFQS